MERRREGGGMSAEMFKEEKKGGGCDEEEKKEEFIGQHVNKSVVQSNNRTGGERVQLNH